MQFCLFPCFIFSPTPTQNPFGTLESSHNLTCAWTVIYDPLQPANTLCLPPLLLAWIKIDSIQILTHLRGPPSSYGGMMTTLTVTDVLSRSIICSWVSVTAATLQISTNRLPCLRPACQAKPYSSTWNSQKKIRVWNNHVCDQDLGWAIWPQPQCRPAEHGSPAVPVRFSLESYRQSHSPWSVTGRKGTIEKQKHLLCSNILLPWMQDRFLKKLLALTSSVFIWKNDPIYKL